MFWLQHHDVKWTLCGSLCDRQKFWSHFCIHILQILSFIHVGERLRFHHILSLVIFCSCNTQRRCKYFDLLCFFIQNIGDGGELKRSVSWEDLIQLPVRIRPTGPGGWGHGCGRGKIPSQHITSTETMKYIKESGMCTKKKEQIKKRERYCMQKSIAKKKKER